MMPPNKPEGNSKEKMKQMRLPFAPIQKENAISKQKEQQEKERERVALEKEKQKQLEAEKAAKEEKLTEPREAHSKDDQKENNDNDIILSDRNTVERKRKLSETSSATSSSKKRTNSDLHSVSSNALKQTKDKNDPNEVVGCDDQLTVMPTKIKIALKSKGRRKSATDVKSNKSINTKNIEDEESDIFDDLDVNKINIAHDTPSSSCSIGESNETGTTCSSVVHENVKSKISCNDKSCSDNIAKCLSNTPQQKLRPEKDDSKKFCSPAVLEERKHRIKVEIAKLLVKINECKDDLEKCVEKQEFLMAQKIKTKITTLEADKLALSSILEREDAVELKDALENRYKKIGAMQLFSTPTVTTNCIVKTETSTPLSSTQNNSKNIIANNDSIPKDSETKVTPTHSEKVKNKEERSKLKEEEKRLKELEKRDKEDVKEKERNERNAQKEKEKKEKDVQREREKKDKEQQKERERIEKLEQKQNERIEKERLRLAKEEEKIKKQLDKELEKEELKKERELEKLRKEQEKERSRKEKEEKELEEKIEKEKQAKLIKPITSFFAKKLPQENQLSNNGQNCTSGNVVTSVQTLNGTTCGISLDSSKHGNTHLSQFIIKKNMKIAPVSRSSIAIKSKDNLDHILKQSSSDEEHNTYLYILRSNQYVISNCGPTWPIQDVAKAREGDECDNDGECQINDEEDDEDQTIASLLELDQSKILEIDIPDESLGNEMNKMNNTSSTLGKDKSNGMFCTTKAKLLQFHENDRPAYWGTWSKKSDVVGPRRPFAKDCHCLEYEYDSDDDWEEEEEGESLSDEEKDKEEDQDMKEEDEDDDGFFVGHGVLDKEEAHLIDSDEEDACTEITKRRDSSSENAKSNVEDDLEIQKMKMRAEQFEEEYKKQRRMPTKLKPRVFGCFWNTSNANSGISENDNKDKIIHDQLMKILQPYGCVVMHTDMTDENGYDAPIDTSHSINIRVKQSPSSKSDNIGTPKVGENSEASNPQSSKKTPGRCIRTFPEEAIPDLIRLVHANSYNKMFLAKEFGVFLQKLDKKRTKNDVKDQNGGRSAKDDCEEDVKEVEVPKTKIISKIQEIAEYKRWTETGNMANRRCWIVRPEVLSDPKWSLNNFNLCEGVNTWKYILEQPKNARPGSTPSANEVFDKDNGVKSNSASPSNTPKRKADESSIDRAYEKPSKYPAPKLLITKFAKVLTPEERMLQMKKLREKAEAEREAANSKVQEKIASITKELIDENSSFSIGDLVWGTMKGHPSWPGKIVIPPEDLKRPIMKKLLHCVKFFGTHDFGWMAEQEVKPYQQFRDALMGGSKVHSFQRALKEIEAFSLGKNIIDAITEPVPINSGLTEPCVPETTDSQNCTKKIETEEKCNK